MEILDFSVTSSKGQTVVSLLLNVEMQQIMF